VSGVTHEALAESVAENKAAIDRVAAEVAAMHGDVSAMKEMLETYTAIKRGGKAVEWLSKVVAACLVIWAFIKGFWQLLIEAGKG
jgi:predicted Rossmann-fold nucleotide-binding protein